jgi:hypothetical protein
MARGGGADWSVIVSQRDTSTDQASHKPQAAEPAPWFGFIGLGIALVAMLLGIGGMVWAVWYFLQRGA